MTSFSILNDLLAPLSKRSLRSEEELRYFIEELSLIVDEALKEDELVELDGLGIFKLLWVDARENLNADIEEGTLIPGHYKLKFIPDPLLVQHVNVPLSHLESIDLDTQKEIPLERLSSQAEDVKSMLHDIQDVKEEAKDVISEEPKLGPFFVTPSGEITAKESNIKDTDSKEKYSIKSVEKKTVNSIKEPMIDANENRDSVWNNSSSSSLNKNSKNMIQEPNETEKDTDERFLSETTFVKSSSHHWMIGLVVLLILVCLGIAYLTLDFNIFNKKSEPPEILMNDTIPEVDVVDSIDIETTTALRDSLRTDSITWYNLTHTEREYDTFIETVRLKKGQYLVDLALQYYGCKDYWVYIYEANKSTVQNPNRVSQGIKLVIPDLPALLIDIEAERTHTYALELKECYIKPTK